MDAFKGFGGELRELALFAGAGGGILGGKLLGWRTVCAVEKEEYARSVLVRRQNEGHLEPFPIWDDVCTFDGRPWRGCVDVVSGGFPCQDISAAGKGAGIGGSRSGLWGEMARIVSEARPRFVFVENAPLLVSRGLGLVLSDLASMGYNARWGIVGADDAGAPHIRKRLWVLAYSNSEREPQSKGSQRNEWGWPSDESKGCWWGTDPADKAGAVESGMGRMADGVAHRVDRIKCLGNGQVPAVAALAWRTLWGLK